MHRLGAAIENPPTYSALTEAGEPGVLENFDPGDDPVDDE